MSDLTKNGINELINFHRGLVADNYNPETDGERIKITFRQDERGCSDHKYIDLTLVAGSWSYSKHDYVLYEGGVKRFTVARQLIQQMDEEKQELKKLQDEKKEAQESKKPA